MELTEIYAGDSIKAKMIANLLQENGIPAFVRNQLLGQIAPFCVTLGGSNATSVEVMTEHAEEAEAIIRNFFGNSDLNP